MEHGTAFKLCKLCSLKVNVFPVFDAPTVSSKQNQLFRTLLLDDMDNRKSKTSPGQNKMTPLTVEQNIGEQTNETNNDK